MCYVGVINQYYVMVDCLIMFMLSRHLVKTFISPEVTFLHLRSCMEKDLYGYVEIAVHICVFQLQWSVEML